MKQVLLLFSLAIMLMPKYADAQNCTPDVTNPQASCQNITVFLDGTGNVTITAADIDGGSSDSCSGVTLSIPPTSFTCADAGPNNVTMTVTDVAGNSTNCIAIVTVIDTLLPTVVCKDTTVYLDASGSITIAASALDGGSSDGCPGLVFTASQTTFTCVDTGANTVTLYVTDGSGNVDSCTATVTVLDTVPPVTVCKDTTIYLDASGSVSIVASDIDGGSADACGGTVTLSVSATTFTCDSAGARLVTLYAEDVDGNIDSCVATVTVLDTIAPMAMCKDTTVYLDATGNITIDSTFIDNGSTDNCSISTMVPSVTSFTCTDTGTNSVTLTVTDSSGNVSTCTSTVTVLDTTSPIANCIDTTIYLDASGNVTIDSSYINNTSTDNCGIVTIVPSVTSFTCTDTGANTVTLTVTDGSGNVSTCTSTVTVLDTLAPMAVCIDTTIYLDATGSFTIDTTFIDGTTDNCSYSASLSATTFTCDSVGVRMVSLFVEDASGNRDTCVAMVTVLDTILPVVICKDTTLYIDNNGVVYIDPSYVLSSATDNCGIDSAWLNQNLASCMDDSVTVTLYVRDASGNMDSCEAKVMILDTTAPRINKDLACTDEDTLSWSANLWFPGTLTNSYTVGTQTFNFTVLDPSGALLTPPTSPVPLPVNAASFQGDLVSSEPSLIISADYGTLGTTNTISLGTSLGQSGVGLNNVSFSLFDVDGGAGVFKRQEELNVTGYLNGVPVNPVLTPVGSQIVAGNSVIGLIPSDASGGNSADGTVKVSFNSTIDSLSIVFSINSDTTPTAGSAPGFGLHNIRFCADSIDPTPCEDTTVYLDAMGMASFDTSFFVNSLFDNCSVDSVWLSQDTVTCSDDTVNITIYAMDASDNIDSCIARVIVLDTVPPMAVCMDTTIYIDSTGMAIIDSSFIDATIEACDYAATLSTTTFTCDSVGTRMVYLYVEDASGNRDTCMATVTVVDSIPPVAVCKDTTIYLDATGSVTILPIGLNGGSYDNCNSIQITSSTSVFTCDSVGVRTVYLYVEDPNGNRDTCISMVTVMDTIPPVAVCKDTTIYLDATGSFTIDSSYLENGSSDNCSVERLTLSASTFTCDSLGVRMVSLYAIDSSGNIDTCVAMVTVLDTIAPMAVCIDTTIYLDATGSFTIDSTFISATVENCSYTATLSATTFTCDSIGTRTVSLLVIDASGNRDSCDATVTVLDTLLPLVLCKDTTIYLDATGSFTIDSSFIDNGSTDNCSVLTLTPSSTTFTCDSIGPRTVYLYAEDGSGNRDTCTAIVTVLDTLLPVAMCKDTTIYLDATGSFTIDSSFIDNGSTDNCLFTTTLSASTFTCDSIGARTVTLLIVDAGGRRDSCTSTVTVLDTLSPVAMCKDTTIYIGASGTMTIDSSYIDNGTFDNCSFTTSLSATTFTCDSVGPRMVSLYVEDGSGNRDTCTSMVTVLDTLSPVVSCKNTIVFLDSMGNASIVLSDIENGSSDNCGVDTIFASQDTFTCADLGTNNVSVIAVDASGNIDSCISIVTVYDIINPDALCKDDTVYLDATGNGSNTAADIDNGSSDNCSITLSLSDSTYTCSDIGANAVTLYVRDISGNLSVCTATVTVLDTVAPTVSCLSPTVYLNAAGTVTISASDIDNGSTDNCGIASRTISTTSFNCSNVGANSVTLVVTDVNGNVDSCISTVTVADTIDPVASCQNVTVYLDSMGNASIDSTDIDNGSSDNCGIATIALSDDSFDCTEVGANTVTVTVTDVNGNVSTCSSVVTVIDNINPTAVCKDDTVYLDATGNVVITTANVDNGSTDNCTFTMRLSDSTFNCTDTGVNTVTLYVTDASGNLSICTSTITVYDTTPPAVMCKNDTAYLDASGNVSIAVSDIDNGTADNCSIASMTLSNTTFNCTDTGVNNVTLTVTDVNGNVDSCIATVTVLDTIAPIAMCQNVTVYLDAAGIANIDSSAVDNGNSDNCAIATVTVSDTAFDCDDLGANMVTVTVTDVSGNSSTCMATVTVLDTINPAVVCQDTTIYLDSTNSIVIDSSYVFTSASDNCGIDSVWFSKSMFTCKDLGPNSVIVYASDSSGNIDSCTSIVTVRLLSQPVKDTIAVQIDVANFAQICLSDNRLLGTPTSYTSCKNVTRGNLINYNDTCFTYTQTSGVKYLDTACVIICDDCGICDTTVLIFVPTPTIDTICVGPVVPVTNVDTCVTLESTYMTGMFINTCDSTSTSNGGIPVTITGLCVRYPVPAPVFTGDSVCMIVCDSIHNVTICDTTLIIYKPDTTPPTVICKDDTVYLNNLGTAMIDTSNVLDTVYDNTLINAVWVTPTTFNCSNAGTNSVTLFARDTNRNIDSCIATITVLDTVAPTAICQNITIQLDSNGNASIVAASVDGGSFDNCAIANITIDKTNFDCSNLGPNVVTLTVTDVHGNSSTCTAIVTVEDNIAPAVYCPGDKQRVVRNTTCEYIVEDFIGEASAVDNCSVNGLTLTQSPVAGTPVTLNNASTTITITATDASGNSSTCTFDVYARCVQELNIPQFFSPNGDGVNDTWEIPELANYPNNTVKVFNRYGNLVFEQKGYYTGWDASSNIREGLSQPMDNKMIPAGTYYYIIDLGTNDIEPYTGYIQVKR